MNQYNMLEAKNNLSKICNMLTTGEEEYVLIAKNGVPVAKIVPYEKHKVILGTMKKKYKNYSLDYDDYKKADEEIAKMFYGE